MGANTNMIGTDTIDRVIGHDVYDESGEKIGSASEVYLDDETGQPEWATVRTGLFGTKESFVPLRNAQLRSLRELNPIHRGINGRWMLFKYEDVKFLLSSPIFKTLKIHEMVASKNRLLNGSENFNDISLASAKWLLFLDPPDHTELRSVVAKIWNKVDLRKTIQEVVAEAIEGLSKQKEVDIVKDFSVFIPSKIICKALGLPVEDYSILRNWSYYFNRVLEPFESLHDLLFYNRKAQEFFVYLDRIIESKKQNPDDAFISKFMSSNQSMAQPLSHSEIVSVISVMFFAGIETSVNLFGQSVFHLIRHPEQARLLREDESILPRAVEELIRYVSPAQYTTRIASEDVTISGKQIKAGDILLGAMVSANRDADVFENPEQLDLTRVANPHLGFGYSLHYCLGARLAREEMSVSIPALFRRFPEIALDPHRNREWETIIINRGLKSLPVILHQ